MKELNIAVAILGVAIAIFDIQGAQAADLGGMKDPVVSQGCDCADAVNWTGISIGIQAGATGANHEIDADINDGETSASLFKLDGLSAQGLSGRIFIQGDYQIGSDWVAGVRGWYGLTDAKVDFSAINGLISASAEEQENYGGVVRIGRLLGSERRTLLYGLGGWQHVSYDLSASVEGTSVDLSGAIETNPKFDGPVLGAGLEHALTRSIFASIEYQHFFGSSEDLSKIPGLKVEDKLNIDSAHAGLRIKF